MLGFILVSFWLCLVLIYLWLLATSTGNVRAKLIGIPVAFVHLVLTRDGKWKKLNDPQETLSLAMKSPESIKKKRIYFVRHGESMWNEVFNRGFDLGIVWRFISSVLHEFHLLPFADSVFWDSPLSPLGIRQAVQLSSWVEHTDPKNTHAAILRGDSDVPSLICSSNLRRAVATTLTAFSGRLIRRSREKVHILSSGQEITRNIDGYSLSAAGCYPGPSWVEVQQPELDKVVSAIYSGDHLDASDNKGNKPLSSNGLKRMTDFCSWVFTNAAAKDVPNIVLGGHSLWFREFFKTFMPYKSTHEAKSKKMVNCGIVAFDLICLHGRYVIDPESVQVVYGGFEDKHSKQKN
jgi:hypothetical protein